MTQTRQLAAIMFTDIVGYTALMGQDEHQGFELLKKNRLLQRPIIEACSGRWIKELGDGVLASFQTVSDAVNAAVRIQEECSAAGEFQLRIGIHLGEIIFEENDVFGDGVNIAARIQTSAGPGCILISEAVHHNISNKKDIETRFVKEQTLKNVSRPVRMYQVMFAGSEMMRTEQPMVSVPEKSIAVLPFANMSGDPEQEYFSDGISEEIINALAQISELKVTGRTSSFAFKGKDLDLKLIGEQLKVSYILEGSVRKSGSRLRITAQLIKVSDGYHLYSEKFDREMEDVFAIQDEIALAILSVIKIKLLGKEKEAALVKYTENLEAYQLYLQGRYWFNKYHPDAFGKAIEYYQAAINVDPGYTIAYAEMANCYWDLAYFSWLPIEQCLPQAIAAANKALELDDENAESNIAVGRIKLWYEWDFAGAMSALKKGIRLNPNNVEGLRQLAVWNMIMGRYGEGHEYIQKADQLDPFSLLNLQYLGVYYVWEWNGEKMLEYAMRLIALETNYFGGHQLAGLAYLIQHKYAEAITELELAAKLNSDMMTLQDLGMAYAQQGETSKARNVLAQMKKIAVENEGNTYFGYVYMAMGEWDQAFEYFHKAVDNHEGHALSIKPFLQNLFSDIVQDPRTAAFLERIGLPD